MYHIPAENLWRKWKINYYEMKYSRFFPMYIIWRVAVGRSSCEALALGNPGARPVGGRAVRGTACCPRVAALRHCAGRGSSPASAARAAPRLRNYPRQNAWWQLPQSHLLQFHFIKEPSLFAVAKLLETGLVNMRRIEILWRPLTGHLLEVTNGFYHLY